MLCPLVAKRSMDLWRHRWYKPDPIFVTSIHSGGHQFIHNHYHAFYTDAIISKHIVILVLPGKHLRNIGIYLPNARKDLGCYPSTLHHIYIYIYIYKYIWNTYVLLTVYATYPNDNKILMTYKESKTTVKLKNLLEVVIQMSKTILLIQVYSSHELSDYICDNYVKYAHAVTKPTKSANCANKILVLTHNTTHTHKPITIGLVVLWHNVISFELVCTDIFTSTTQS